MIEIFCDGLNKPLQSELRHEGPRSSLTQFMDYALLSVGSLFTVGVAEEERDNASLTEMVAAPECAHKMAVTAEPDRKMVDTTTPRHAIAASHEPSQFTVDLKEPNQVTVHLKEPSQVMDLDLRLGLKDNLRESNQVTVDRYESLHVSADLPESFHVFADHPELLHATADHPESHHVSADSARLTSCSPHYNRTAFVTCITI